MTIVLLPNKRRTLSYKSPSNLPNPEISNSSQSVLKDKPTSRFHCVLLIQFQTIEFHIYCHHHTRFYRTSKRTKTMVMAGSLLRWQRYIPVMTTSTVEAQLRALITNSQSLLTNARKLKYLPLCYPWLSQQCFDLWHWNTTILVARVSTLQHPSC